MRPEHDGRADEVVAQKAAARARVKLEQLIATGRSRAAYVVAAVGRGARGFRSDRFRRRDAGPIVDAFAQAGTDLGAVLADGYVSDSGLAVITLLPCLHEPVPSDPVVFGVMLEDRLSSEGGLSISALTLRLASTTYLIDGLRIGDGGGVAGRDPNVVTAVRDVVLFQLAPERIDQLQVVIQRAHEERIDRRQAGALLRRSLTRAEAGQAVEMFNSSDVGSLPPGHTTWRLSNTVSWLAGPSENAERKLDLMKVAGALLPNGG